MSVRYRSLRKLIACSLAAAPAALFSVPAAAGYAGLTVEEAIAEFNRLGLHTFHTSDLVRPWMMVADEPQAQSAEDALQQILLPHGLMLRKGFNDTWLIVKQPGRVAAVSTTPTATVPLQRAPNGERPMEQIVVSGSRYEILGSQTSPARSLTDYQLSLAPDVGDDALRAVARLPGMAASDYTALPSIRGGEIRETLVRLDGLRLYDPFHLRDFQSVFSVIDPRVVEKMDVYSGGFPVGFGDRMSGVIDIETMSPPDDLYHEVGLSFFNTSVMSAGRYADARGEWLVSARRSNLDILYDRFSEQPERPRYTDVLAKLEYTLSDRLSISGNLLQATDTISLADDVDREERAEASQTDTYLWFSLDHNLNGVMRGRTLVSRTEINSNRAGTSSKLGVSSGSLSDTRSFALDAVQSEWERVVGARSMLQFGASVARHRGDYDYRDNADFDLLFDIPGAPTDTSRSRQLAVQPSGHQYSVFASLRTDLNRRVSTEAGLRWSENAIDQNSFATVEPRLGLRVAVTDRTDLRASWGRFYQSQGITELYVSDGHPELLRPQRADQVALGFDRRLGQATLLRVEAYRKRIRDAWPRPENLLNRRVLLPELKPDRLWIEPDSATARGVEIALDGLRGSFDWWGHVTWSEVTDDIEGREVLRSWDQTWSLSAGFNFSRNLWSAGLGLAYHTGWPTTPAGLETTAPFPTALAASRNSDRLGNYGSLDVRVNREIPTRRGKLTVFTEVANLFGRENPCCVEYEIGDEEDNGLLILDQRHFLPRIPSIGFNWAF